MSQTPRDQKNLDTWSSKWGCLSPENDILILVEKLSRVLPDATEALCRNTSQLAPPVLAAEGFWRAQVMFATYDLLHPEPGHCTALRAPATSSHSVPTLRGNGGSPRVTWTENAAALMAFEDLQSVLTPPPHGDHLSVIHWSTRAMMSLLINKAQHLVLLLCNYLLWIVLLSSLVLLWLSS